MARVKKEEKEKEVVQPQAQVPIIIPVPYKLAEAIQLYLQTKPIQECIDLFSALGKIMTETLDAEGMK